MKKANKIFNSFLVLVTWLTMILIIVTKELDNQEKIIWLLFHFLMHYLNINYFQREFESK